MSISNESSLQNFLTGIGLYRSGGEDTGALEEEIKAHLEEVRRLLTRIEQIKSAAGDNLSVQNMYEVLHRDYPYMYLQEADSGTFGLGVGDASMFFHYSGRLVYADAPVHSIYFTFDTSDISHIALHIKNEMVYDNCVSDDWQDIFARRRHFGHPHVSVPFNDVPTTSGICFGNNRGIADLAVHLGSRSDFLLLCRKVWAWITEINLNDCYHTESTPFQLQGQYEIPMFDWARIVAGKSEELYLSDVYRDMVNILTEFPAEGDRDWWRVSEEIVRAAVPILVEAAERVPGVCLRNKLNGYREFITSNLSRGMVGMEQMLCLHQLLTGVRVAEQFRNGVTDSIQLSVTAPVFSDLLTGVRGWTRVAYANLLTPYSWDLAHNNSARPDYPITNIKIAKSIIRKYISSYNG